MIRNKNKYLHLQKNKPGVVRYSGLMFLYRLIGVVISWILIILGISMLVNAGFGNRLLYLITQKESLVNDIQVTSISYFIGYVLIGLGILFSIIARLAKRLIARNMYILELEEILNDEVYS